MKKFANNTNPLMKGPVHTKGGWSPPTSAIVPQDNDKIINYVRDKFKNIYEKK